MLVRHKHSSLLETLINYSCKEFYNIGPWSQCQKIFFITTQIHLSSQQECQSWPYSKILAQACQEQMFQLICLQCQVRLGQVRLGQVWPVMRKLFYCYDQLCFNLITLIFFVSPTLLISQKEGQKIESRVLNSFTKGQTLQLSGSSSSPLKNSHTKKKHFHYFTL